MSIALQTSQESGYPQLRRRLLEQLLSGQFPAGARFHSVRDVAQWPGATAHLAQRALAELCRDGYLESVPKKGLFVRNGNRQPQREEPQTQWRQLAFLVPPGSNRSRVNELLPIVSESLDPDRWRMEVVYLKDDYAEHGGFRFAEGVVARRPTAVVWLMPAPSDLLLLRYLVTSGIPVLTYNRDFSTTGAMGVVADVTGVAHRLYRHVYDHGKRRLAVLSVDRPSPSIQRFWQVVVDEATADGLSVSHVTIPFSEEQRPEISRQIDELMTGPDRPDGIVCAESYSLLAVEHWLHRHPEVVVPRDLAIASFDRTAVRHVVRVLPPIPRGDMDHPSMMAEAMRMIDQELSGRRVDPLIRAVPAILIDESVPTPVPAPVG